MMKLTGNKKPLDMDSIVHVISKSSMCCVVNKSTPLYEL